MKAKPTTSKVHGRDIVVVAGGVVDQEHGVGTVEVAQQQFTGREKRQNLYTTSKM